MAKAEGSYWPLQFRESVREIESILEWPLTPPTLAKELKHSPTYCKECLLVSSDEKGWQQLEAVRSSSA